MKRLAALVLPLCLIFFSACNEPAATVDSSDVAVVSAAVESFNGETLRDTVFRLSFSEKDADEVLFYTSGNAAVRNEAPIAMSGRMTQIEHGNAITADMFYKAGAYYYENGSGKYYLVMNRESFLKQFFCADVPMPDSPYALRKAESSGGLKYEFGAKGSDSVFQALFADAVYDAAPLRRVDRKRTTFGNGLFSYVIKDGSLTAVTISFDVSMYDTPAYYPNYTPTDAELMHEYTVTYELTVTNTGDSVNITVPNTEDYTFLS